MQVNSLTLYLKRLFGWLLLNATFEEVFSLSHGKSQKQRVFQRGFYLVVSTVVSTVSPWEHSHKKQENVIMTIFRNKKSRYEKLEAFFQIMFFIKYLRGSLSLVEL